MIWRLSAGRFGGDRMADQAVREFDKKGAVPDLGQEIQARSTQRGALFIHLFSDGSRAVHNSRGAFGVLS